MASRFCGFFDVSFTWLDGQCVSDAFAVDDWLLVGCCADSKISTFGYVEVVSVDWSRRDALHMLRKFIHDDSYQRTNWDYEIWHVVEKPDWMPAQPYTLNCVELLDHADRGVFDETLVWCDLEEIPGNGVVVLCTSWGFYVPAGCQTASFPHTLDELTDWNEYDFVEVDAENDYFAWVPTSEIDAFCGACEGLVSRCDGLEWCDVQRLRISGDALRRMVSA